MTYDDKALFNQAMKDVRPLKQRASLVFLPAKTATSPRSTPERQPEENFLTTELFAPLPCEMPLYFKQDGIQQGLIDKLGRGKYDIDASLNLNISRMPVAREECRTLLIIHGGSGACYVALRKSARAKSENRERHAKRLR
ncbi:putative DNA endonuclease SmrA [Sodalis glossinidius str. 'morsitans']|uniref:Putative DNA endonuclease SmrA n=1 Tax=Sodalis glossinidius (strain morsitans) TaxID=343509 RepID=Q2NSW7_SODGM|nr:hypothetical protein [Sodalis glossinidius]BAE74758.1 conserved hypothetical protein [Sodalis glossinidius str. 'morsitans']CRL45542.1 putative DNA endonuclease SmrA [Sodalis glossinidius str. 'morsitans']